MADGRGRRGIRDEKWCQKGTHDVKKFIKPAELIGWIDQTPLKEQHITGLHYNPLTNTFKLAPGVDVNYMLHTTAKKSITSYVFL